MLFIRNSNLTGCSEFHLAILLFSSLQNNEDLETLGRHLVIITVSQSSDEMSASKRERWKQTR